MGTRMLTCETSKSVLCLILLCLPIYSSADEARRIYFAEYKNKITALNSGCDAKGMPSFSGFCLSKEYGKISYSNPTQTSIGLGLEVASFELFYSNCEHSNFSSASDALVKTKKLLDAEKYYEEIKTQKEALENYVSHHYFCKTKVENDATILNRLKWFEYMSAGYSASTASGNGSVSNIIPSNKATEYVGGIGKDRLSLVCNESAMVDTHCLIRVGSAESAQPVRFVTQPTRYGHLLRIGIEKALAPDQNLRRLNASDTTLLRKLSFDRCHPAEESKGISGDLLQLCIPTDSSRVVLFMRGLCDRCVFEPLVLERQASQ